MDFTARIMFVFGVIALSLWLPIFAVDVLLQDAAHPRDWRAHGLGCKRRDVLRLVVGDSLRLTVPGLIIGTVCAWGLTHALSSLLFGVLRPNVWLFALMTALLVVVAMFAAYLPAVRAARVDPVEALRCE